LWLRTSLRDARFPPHTPNDVRSKREGVLFHAVTDAGAGPKKVAPPARCLVDVGGDVIVLLMHGEAACASDTDDQPVGRREQMREVGGKRRE